MLLIIITNKCLLNISVPYDFSKNYISDFTEVFRDLNPGDTYFVDFTGFTTGTFQLSITGDIKAPVQDSFTNRDFKPGYAIEVTA